MRWRRVKPAAALLLVLIVLEYGCALAFAGRVLTLEESLRLTLDYSRDILIAAEERDFSYGRYVEQRAAALPQLRAEASAARSRNETLLIGGGSDVNETQANLSLSQALFTWGQIGAAIRAAKYDREATEHQIEAARQLVLRETATAFYNLLFALELERVARERVEQRQRHLDETQRKHQLEVATDYDVLAAQVALTNAQPALTQAENGIRLAKDRLRYFTGIQEDFEISGSLSCDLKAPDVVESVIERAKAQRPEVAAFHNRVGTFKELVKVARGGNKPRLDFRGNAGWSGFSGPGLESPDGKRWDAGVFLSFPIFDGLQTKGRVTQAQSQLSTTELQLLKLFDDIALEARDATNGVLEAIEIVRDMEATTIQAERLLEMAEAGYRYGVKTKLEVDDAQFNLVSTRSNLARARRDYLVAQTRLLWILGEDLLEALQKRNGAFCSTGVASRQ